MPSTYVREFDGSDDFVTLSIGAIPSFTFGAMWCLVWSADFTPATVRHCVAVGDNGSVANSVTLGVSTTGNVRVVNNGSTARSGAVVLTDSRWHIIGFGKATGTATPRLHIWDPISGWQHENASGTQANNADTHDIASIGAGTLGGGPFGGRIAAAAIKQGDALSDATFETFSEGVGAWWKATPSALWILDQSVTTEVIRDETGGGANESALTGTTVQTDTAPITLLLPFQQRTLQGVG